jgi:hypothetical protein
MRPPYIFDDEARRFFEEHFLAISHRMHEMRLYRNPWRVEVHGCIFKFTITGYAKKGSERWQQEMYEREAVSDTPPDTADTFRKAEAFTDTEFEA